MAEQKFVTVDIVTDVSINGRTYTPTDRIVTEAVGREIVEKKAGLIISPNMTPEEVIAKTERTVAAAEKQANS